VKIVLVPAREPDGRRQEASHRSRRWTVIVMLIVMLIALSRVSDAQDRQMRIYRNKVLVLTTCKFLEPVPSTTQVPMFSLILQQDPFVEVHLKQPLSPARLEKQHRFICDEVGTFENQRSSHSWTIGKSCRPQ